jgi:uncharacterized protein (DUF1697 family)
MARTQSNRRSARTYVAFLRGINVGGKNLLPMADLARMFEAAGCRAVRTYIQSGNVIFDAGASLARSVPKAISLAILQVKRLAVPVVVRSVEELLAAARSNPFPKADPETLHIAFLADEPSAARVATLDPHRSPPDEFVVRGREVHLHLPSGVARTRLTNAYLDSKLETVSTLRRRSTVAKLLELAGEPTTSRPSLPRPRIPARSEAG